MSWSGSLPKAAVPVAGTPALLATLQARFIRNAQRHPGLQWDEVLAKLLAQPAKLQVLQHMEDTGGEPDVVLLEPSGGAKAVKGEPSEFLFADCSAESPIGRRSLCFDEQALNARKEAKPAGSAQGLAAKMGAELMSEAQYRALQTLGRFDEKTSSWVATAPAMRALGGALFCDRRFGAVFTYHNGVQSYYAARGFRCVLRV